MHGTISPQRLTVEADVSAPVADVWRAYTTPADIIQWNAASDDWHTTAATVDPRWPPRPPRQATSSSTTTGAWSDGC